MTTLYNDIFTTFAGKIRISYVKSLLQGPEIKVAVKNLYIALIIDKGTKNQIFLAKS